MEVKGVVAPDVKVMCLMRGVRTSRCQGFGPKGKYNEFDGRGMKKLRSRAWPQRQKLAK